MLVQSAGLSGGVSEGAVLCVNRAAQGCCAVLVSQRTQVRLGSSTAEEELVADKAVGPLLTPGSSAHGAEHDPKVPDPTGQVCCRHVNSSAMLGWLCAQADGLRLSAGVARGPSQCSCSAHAALPALAADSLRAHLQPCAEPHGQPHILPQERNAQGWV